MIKLYYHHTPNPAKVALMLEETGLPYEAVGVDTYKGEQHGAAYRAINPNGKVPAIADDGVIVFDSNAILLYLAEKTDRFLGAKEDRPRLLSWLMFTASGLGPYSGQAFHFTRVHGDSAYATNRYMREVERHYSVMEARLAASAFLAGREYTIADIAAWGWLDWAARNQFVFTDADAPQRWPSVRRWLTEINARPAVERSRKAGSDLKLKTEFDEETLRAMFPQNFATAL
jgi:GSH-dependent disulfide-bond oxidoreductase